MWAEAEERADYLGGGDFVIWLTGINLSCGALGCGALGWRHSGLEARRR